MNQLTGRFVAIVLSVRDGRGFSPSQNLYVLEASLNGRKIQADPVPGISNPMFCTELVWEIEKKEIRKLRSAHVPLRVECFSLDSFHQRERIGFVLLHLRSARPITSGHYADIDYRWNRLLGVRHEHKATHPEVSISLTIRDKLKDIPMPRSAPPLIEQTIKEELAPNEYMEPLNENVSVLYLEDGFIQIGEGESSRETFTLSFLIETVFNVDLIIPRRSIFHQKNDEFYITVSFFDLTINTKTFSPKDIREPVILNDKIMFKLHSNNSFLMNFFEQYKVATLKFCQGSETIATAEINLKNFNFKEFFVEPSNLRTKYEQDCIFFALDTGRVPEDKYGRKPFVSTQSSLVRNETDKFFTFPGQPKQELKAPYMERIEDTQACGDQIIALEPTMQSLDKRPDTPYVDAKSHLYPESEKSVYIKPEKKPSVMDLEKSRVLQYPESSSKDSNTTFQDTSAQTSARENRIARSAFTNLKDVSATNSLHHSPIMFDDEDYHLYSLTTIFQTLVWKRLHCEGFQFRFKHPKANTVLIVQCNSDCIVSQDPITLENVKCVQHFVSTPKFISTLMYTYPCKVTICDEDNCNITEEFELYTKLFLSQNNKIASGVDVCACSYSAMISDENNEDEIVCDLQIDMCLSDQGLSPDNYEKTCYDLSPLVLDERLAFKTLNELEIWKKHQQLQFDERQKCVEAEKLKILNTEWEKKREDLERKLQTGIEKCRVLSEELIFAAHELESKKKTYEVKKRYAENPEHIEMQVTQMMELEMNFKIDQIRKENMQLIDRINAVQIEKDKLKDQILQRELDLEEYKRSHLNEEQTKNLFQELRGLEEKYRQEQNAKIFFKEQWQKAVREVHYLKAKDQKHIQSQIKKKKDELSQLSLQDFVNNSDSSDNESTNSLMSCPSGECRPCMC